MDRTDAIADHTSVTGKDGQSVIVPRHTDGYLMATESVNYRI